MASSLLFILMHIVTRMSAWAHHPVVQPEPKGGRPDTLIWVLGIGVFLVVFIVTWVIFSFVERRQRLSPHQQESMRGS